MGEIFLFFYFDEKFKGRESREKKYGDVHKKDKDFLSKNATAQDNFANEGELRRIRHLFFGN